MRVLAVFVFHVLHAIAKVFAWAESAGILMVDNTSQHFTELTTIQLCWFPITLNETALQGDELLYKRLR
jgi:hypothetical protein